MANESIMDRMLEADTSQPTESHMGRTRGADGSFFRPQQKAEIMANMELNRQGSLMGSEKANQREFESQNPVLSSINKAVDFLNPINWMGSPGTSGAVFSPIRTAGQKQMAKGLFRALAKPEPGEAPERAARIAKSVMQDIQSNPGMNIEFQVGPRDPGTFGSTAERVTTRGLKQIVNVPEGAFKTPHEGRGLPSTIAHEVLGHAIDFKSKPTGTMESYTQLFGPNIDRGFFMPDKTINPVYQTYPRQEAFARAIESGIEAKFRAGRGQGVTGDDRRMKLLENYLYPDIGQTLMKQRYK